MKALKYNRFFYGIFCCVFAQSALALAAEEVEKWEVDIEYYRLSLEEKHIDLFHTLDKATFNIELDNLKNKLLSLNQFQVKAELTRITALVSDGHTRFRWWNNSALFPVQFVEVDQELRLERTSERYQHLLGWKLTGVANQSLAEVKKQLQPYVAGVDNEYSLANNLRILLGVSEVLYAVGISNNLDAISYQFADDNGATETITIQAVAPADYRANMNAALPSYRKPIGGLTVRTNGAALFLDNDKHIGYLLFNNYPDFGEINDFSIDCFEALKNNNTRYLIIDMRNNGGGNAFIGLSLISHIIRADNLDWKNGIYVLIGTKTFSAAVTNASQYRRLLNAKLVGEPTGGNPNGYQDVDSFVLPNTQLTVDYSKRLFNMEPEGTNALQPDVKIPVTWADYQAQIDAPLNWILNEIQKEN